MTKLTLGNQVDDSSSTLSLDTDGGSSLEIQGGELRDRSRQDVRVRDRQSESAIGAGSAPSASAAPLSGSDDSWRRSVAIGALLVMSLVVVSAVFVLITRFAS